MAGHIMQPQGELAVAEEVVALDHSNTLVLDDDDSTSEQKSSMHVHFDYSQLSQSMHHTGPSMPEEIHPGRSKRGSFFPGHALDSSSSPKDPADSSAISWSNHAPPQQQTVMPRHDQGSGDSLDASGQETITWSLSSQKRTTSTHIAPQRIDRYRQAGGRYIRGNFIPGPQIQPPSLSLWHHVLQWFGSMHPGGGGQCIMPRNAYEGCSLHCTSC